MKVLRVGIIGLGVGEQHIYGYNANPFSEAVALCDSNPTVLEQVGNRHPGLKTTLKAEEILADPNIDVVSIASYDNCHYEQVMQGLACEKHLFVEKPLCQYAWQAEEISRTLNTHPHLVLSSNLILRLSPRFQHLKKLIDKGELGQIYYLEGSYDYGRLEKITEGWRGRLDYYSVVAGGAVHLIDLLYWLSGDEVVEVSAYGNNICSQGSAYRGNDFVSSILKLKSGAVARVTANFGCVRPHFHGLSIYGTKATYYNAPGPALLYRSRDKNSKPELITSEYPGISKGDLIAGFIDTIIGEEGSHRINREDLFRTMSVCFAVEEALSIGKPVSVSYL